MVEEKEKPVNEPTTGIADDEEPVTADLSPQADSGNLPLIPEKERRYIISLRNNGRQIGLEWGQFSHDPERDTLSQIVARINEELVSPLIPVSGADGKGASIRVREYHETIVGNSRTLGVSTGRAWTIPYSVGLRSVTCDMLSFVDSVRKARPVT